MGTAGENFTAAFSSITFSDALSVTAYQPGGAILASGSVVYYAPIFQVPTLPATGTYSLVVTPAPADIGAADVQLLEDVEGTLVVDGGVVPVSLVPGQYGHYTFAGLSGLPVDVAVAMFSTSPAYGQLDVVVDAPPTESIYSAILDGVFSAAGHAELAPLPETGSYDLWVEPETLFDVDAGIQLVPPVLGSLTVGTPVTFSTSLVGQQAIYTFSGTAGQNLSIGLTGNTFGDATAGVFIDSSEVTDTNVSSSSAALDLQDLAVSGTYTLILEPSGTDTGEVTIELFEDATGTVTTDGGTTAVTLGAGQRGDYTFTANAGDWIGGGATSVSTTPSGGTVYLYFYDPSGSSVDFIPVTTDSSFALPLLTSSGTYTVRVEPDGATAASLSLDVDEPATGSLDSGPATLTPATVGQQGVYTFNGNSGDNDTLYVTDVTFSSDALVTVYQPSGAALTDGVFDSNGSLDLSGLPATGTYTVVATPEQTDSGSLKLTLN